MLMERSWGGTANFPRRMSAPSISIRPALGISRPAISLSKVVFPTPDLPAITRLQQMKTGALIGAAVEFGAIMGRASPEIGRAHV